MASKSRLYRILDMINILSNNYKKWRVKELAEHFDVTSRTIYRDFEIMDQIKIPIYKDEINHTYSILENFYFQPPDINEDEALALLLVSQAFQEEIFPYQKDLDTAISKIINSLPFSIKKVVDDLATQIIYQQGAFVDLKNYKMIIREIEEAISNHCSIVITYYSLSSDQTSERKIDPYRIAYKNGACYLIAYCHSRHDVLIFRVDRIKDFNVINENFFENEDFDINEYLKNSWGVERSNHEQRVVLIFKGIAAKLVKEMKWHDSQEIINLPGDKIRFEVTTSSVEEIKSWILSYGANVEVVRPRVLKQELVEEIKKMQNIYK